MRRRNSQRRPPAHRQAATIDAATEDAVLRVAIDVGPLYGHRTGVGLATAGIIEALEASGAVHLDRFALSLRSRPYPGDRRLPLPGIVASHCWSRSNRPRPDRWLHGADVVHGTNYVVPPSRLPSVVTVYDCWFLRHPELAAPVVRRAGERLRRAVRAGALVHASSEHTASQVKELLGTQRVCTVLLGPPPPPEVGALAASHAAMIPPGDRFLLAIATEERRKSLVSLVAAFGLLHAEHRDVRLVMVGSRGDDSTAIDRSVAELPPSACERVARLGRVDDGSKAWLLRHAEVLVYPSLDEGFGYPVLEAQQMGTPVVASDSGAIGEIGGAGVLPVSAATPERLAAAVSRALDDRGLRLQLIAAGHENLLRYDWAATADGLLALYRRAISERR